MKDQKRIQRMITFPTNLFEALSKKAQRRGLLATEYIRYLVIKDLGNEFEKTEEQKEEQMEDFLDAYL